jgi:hypothetical protein
MGGGRAMDEQWAGPDGLAWQDMGHLLNVSASLYGAEEQ